MLLFIYLFILLVNIVSVLDFILYPKNQLTSNSFTFINKGIKIVQSYHLFNNNLYQIAIFIIPLIVKQ